MTVLKQKCGSPFVEAKQISKTFKNVPISLYFIYMPKNLVCMKKFKVSLTLRKCIKMYSIIIKHKTELLIIF